MHKELYVQLAPIVVILVFAADAHIVIPPRNTTALEGSSVRLDCLAVANPDNITYHWFRNGYDIFITHGPGQQLTSLSRSNMMTSLLINAAGSLPSRSMIAPNGSLIVTSVSRDDTGWYRCRPNNGVGVPPEAQAFLNVTCELLFHNKHILKLQP